MDLILIIMKVKVAISLNSVEQKTPSFSNLLFLLFESLVPVVMTVHLFSFFLSGLVYFDFCRFAKFGLRLLSLIL